MARSLREDLVKTVETAMTGDGTGDGRATDGRRTGGRRGGAGAATTWGSGVQRRGGGAACTHHVHGHLRCKISFVGDKNVP
jgi:hypothetical protein